MSCSEILKKNKTLLNSMTAKQFDIIQSLQIPGFYSQIIFLQKKKYSK